MAALDEFPHNFTEQAYQETLLELFKPGSGHPPPTLAGRAVEETLATQAVLGPVIKGKAPSREAVLYGPRGNGKTVLLGKFEAICRDAGVHVVALRPKLVKTTADMAGLLLHNDDEAMAGLLEKAKPDSVTLGVPGIGAMGWHALSQAEKDSLRMRHLEGLLRVRCRKTRLVVTVDEAHTLDIDMGGMLLNLSEALRKQGAPFGLVLAGTPNLRAHLQRMGASFWGRSEKLGIGRLKEADVKTALQVPLQGLSVTFEPAALDEVAEDCQGYPYFTQLWGSCLCNVLVNEIQSHTITSGIVEQVRDTVAFKRQDYYFDRYREILDQDLLGAATALGELYLGDVDNASQITLCETLISAGAARDIAEADTQIQSLSDLGYLWSPPPTAVWEAGIPSIQPC